MALRRLNVRFPGWAHNNVIKMTGGETESRGAHWTNHNVNVSFLLFYCIILIGSYSMGTFSCPLNGYFVKTKMQLLSMNAIICASAHAVDIKGFVAL